MSQLPKAVTVPLPTAASLLGISASSAYRQARSGTFATPVIKSGGRYVVPTRPLLALLGLDELPEVGPDAA